MNARKNERADKYGENIAYRSTVYTRHGIPEHLCINNPQTCVNNPFDEE